MPRKLILEYKSGKHHYLILIFVTNEANGGKLKRWEWASENAATYSIDFNWCLDPLAHGSRHPSLQSIDQKHRQCSVVQSRTEMQCPSNGPNNGTNEFLKSLFLQSVVKVLIFWEKFVSSFTLFLTALCSSVTL